MFGFVPLGYVAALEWEIHRKRNLRWRRPDLEIDLFKSKAKFQSACVGSLRFLYVENLSSPNHLRIDPILASYSQPSSSSHSPDLTSLLEAEGEMYAAEAEITRWNAEAIDWEPSPEGDDGIPRTYYCGSEPVHGYSQTPKDPYRRYITCPNADDRDCHVWKWWDVAVEEELREFKRELNGVKGEANQREQKLLRLEKQVSEFTKKKSGAKLMVFSLVLGLVLLIVL
ncbi:hypothetical protein IGI04_007438, partial [Brassica rapa subsp. trilocularis]